jgi:peroxiredoxin
MRSWLGLLVCGVSFLAAAQETPKGTHLKVGETAPDFTLPSTTGKDISLSDFRGKENVVLAFVVKAFTGG